MAVDNTRPSAAAGPRTRFITFYSYKGGVGRTLALANTARYLTAQGRKVVVVDFDLEAPGLDHFAAFRPKGESKKEARRPLSGFAEYLSACRSGSIPESLQPYLHRCTGQKVDQGVCWLMPAGRHGDPGYQEILDLEWDRFYHDEDGFRVMENLRGQIIDELAPDYVLMDSRTGLSEIGGIATHQLADLVVLLFNLNRQNLEGTRRVHDSLLRCKPAPTLVLAASPIPPMPTDKGTPFWKRMQTIARDLKGAANANRPVVIPYQAVLALEERILIDQHDDPFDSDEAYRKLINEILQQFADPKVIMDGVLDRLRESNIDAAIQTLDKGLAENPLHPQLARMEVALLMSQGKAEAARPLSEQLAKKYPDSADVWASHGNVLSDCGDLPGAIEAYRKAIEIKPDMHGAWSNLGIDLGKSGDLPGAIEAYRKAIEIKPEMHEAWYNLACTKALQGQQKEAFRYLRRAVEQDPKHATFAASDTDWDDLRDDPEFQAIVRTS